MIATSLLALAALFQAQAAEAPALPAATAVQAAPAATPEQTAAQAAAQTVAQINAVLNSVDTLQARFTQSDQMGGVAQGTLYLRRPGRLRFDYDEPTPILIVADGQTVAIEDSDLETVDRAPLRSTPLWWILKEEVDLAADARILDVYTDGRLHFITLEDPSEEVQGRVQLVFDLAAGTLWGWYAVDAYGQITTLQLNEVETGMRLNPRLFILEEEEDGRRGRRGR
jgi:outer membrane lipoprotein-sorting protein